MTGRGSSRVLAVVRCEMMERSVLAGAGGSGRGRRKGRRGGGARVAVEQGRVPDAGDDGAPGGRAAAEDGRAAAPTEDGGDPPACSGEGSAAVQALRDG